MRQPLISLLFCSFVYISAGAQIKYSVKEFRIAEATVQGWSPGAVQPNSKQGGGSIYQIKLTISKNNPLRFDSLYIDGNLFPVEVVKGAERNYTGVFTKGDIVLILARQDNGEVPVKASAKLTAGISKSKKTGKGFISYWINMKRYITPITEFKVNATQQRNQ